MYRAVDALHRNQAAEQEHRSHDHHAGVDAEHNGANVDLRGEAASLQPRAQCEPSSATTTTTATAMFVLERARRVPA